jgi:hypothetical protein
MAGRDFLFDPVFPAHKTPWQLYANVKITMIDSAQFNYPGTPFPA